MLTTDQIDNAPLFDASRPFRQLVEMFYLGAGGLLSVRHGWALPMAGLDERGATRFLTLTSADESPADDCHVPIRRVFSPDTTDHGVEHDFVVVLAVGLLTRAFDAVFGENAEPPDGLRGRPAIEVFRHIRNACAHGNRFHFRGDEPRRGGDWGPVKLTSAADARGPQHPLHGRTCVGDVIAEADVIWLLRDVEQLVVDSEREQQGQGRA